MPELLEVLYLLLVALSLSLVTCLALAAFALWRLIAAVHRVEYSEKDTESEYRWPDPGYPVPDFRDQKK